MTARRLAILTAAAGLTASCATPGQTAGAIGGCTVGALVCGGPGAAVLWSMAQEARDPVEGFGARMKGSPYSAREVGDLLALFVRHWAAAHPEERTEAIRAIDRLDIRWVSGASFMSPQGKEVRGLTHSAPTDRARGVIEVAAKSLEPIGSTALAHELAHVVLAVTTGDSGADHLAAGSTWTQAVNDLVVAVQQGREP